MGNETCFLITILADDQLLRCALRIPNEEIPGDVGEYPMEPENKLFLHSMLPDYVRKWGPVVAVENIFSVHVVTKGETS